MKYVLAILLIGAMYVPVAQNPWNPEPPSDPPVFCFPNPSGEGIYCI